MTKSRRHRNIGIIVSGGLIITLVACYFLLPGFQRFINEGFEVLTSDDQDAAKKWVGQFGMMGPIVIIVAMIIQMFMFIIPNILLMMIAILSYGPVWGGLLSWFGVFAASSVGYFVGGRLGTPALNHFVSEKTRKKLMEFVRDYGMGAIMLTRLSSFSNDGLSIVAGVLQMSYWRYIAATLTGIAPLIVILGIYGRNGKIEKALIWISAISIVLLVLYIIIDKRRKKSRARK